MSDSHTTALDATFRHFWVKKYIPVLADLLKGTIKLMSKQYFLNILSFEATERQ